MPLQLGEPVGIELERCHPGEEPVLPTVVGHAAPRRPAAAAPQLWAKFDVYEAGLLAKFPSGCLLRCLPACATAARRNPKEPPLVIFAGK